MNKQRRKRVNFVTKAVSILLIVVMMIVFLPETMTVLAEEIKSAESKSEQSQQVEQEEESTYEPDFSVENINDTPAEQEEAYILYEAEYKRSEYEKHFYMSNGTYMRETYAMPIHYLDGEEYKDIDNTLVEYTEGGKEKIKNAGNSFTAEFAKEISEDEPLLSVEKGEYSLEMYYEQKGGDEAQQARLGEQGKVTIQPVQAEIKVDKAKAQKEEISYAGKKLKDSIKNENLESELRYSGVEQDTDFEYKLDSTSVKESIIVGSRQQSYTYSFRMQTKNLFLEHDNYGRIRAYNAQEEEIYTIPAPYMFDAAGNRSEAVTYELKYTKDSDYILSVIADSEWINAEERIFPVTIDPTIETSEENEGEENIDYYVEELGVEGTYNPYSYDGGDYSIYIKPQTLSYTIEIPYISLQAPSSAMAITAYYNPGFSAVRSSLYSDAQDYYGEDIKLNIEQYMIPQYNESADGNIVAYIYIDADGTVHNFLPKSNAASNTKYFNTMLGYTYNSLTNKMSDGTDFDFMTFDDSGRLQYIESKNGDYIGITYFENNKIDYIDNKINGITYQAINLEYNGLGKLAELYGTSDTIVTTWDSDLDYTYQRAHRVQLSYSASKLYSVKDNNNDQLVKIANRISDNYFDVYNRYNGGHGLTVISDNTTRNPYVTNIDKIGKEDNQNLDQIALGHFELFENSSKLGVFDEYGVFTGDMIHSYDNKVGIKSSGMIHRYNRTFPTNISYTKTQNRGEVITDITTLTAVFDHKEYEFENYSVLNNTYTTISKEEIAKNSNPVYVAYVSGYGSKVSIYYNTVGGQGAGSTDTITIPDNGMFFLLPITHKDVDIQAGIRLYESGAFGTTIAFAGIGEMVSKEEMSIYSKDYGQYQAGDIDKTVVTPQGKTITTIKDGKTIREEFWHAISGYQETTYTYDDNDLVISTETKTVVNGVENTETTSNTYDERRRVTSTTTEQGTHYYEYNDLDFLVSETTVDGITYSYQYVQYPQLAETLLDAVIEVHDDPTKNVQKAVYTYDEDGKLIKVQDTKGTLEYIYDGNKFVGYKQERPSTNNNVSWDDSVPIGSDINLFTYDYNGYGDIAGINYNNQDLINYSMHNANVANDTITYADGQKEEYFYNDSGFITSVKYSLGNTTQAKYNYTYNDYGEITNVTKEGNDIIKEYSEDSDVRIYTETVTSGNYEFNNTATYDANDYYIGSNYTFTHDTLASQDAERERSVQYESYMLGLLRSETDEIYTTYYTYNEENELAYKSHSDGENHGTSYTYTYNEKGQVTQMSLSSLYYKGSYWDRHAITYDVTYDEYGNIDIVEYGDETIDYTYDKAGRLTREENTAADVYLDYRYDRLNNLMLTYHLNHDANGNISGYTNAQGTGNVSLTWTQGNKLETVTNSNGTYRYSYDENGLRYKKERIENGTVTSTTRYYYDGTSIIAEDRDGELIQYYYDSMGVIGMSYNGEDYLYYKDIFGNITHIINSDFTIVAQYEYDAWGNYGIETNVNGIATVNPFRYRGYYMDAESDYYYLQTRYYSPVLRRFLSHDRYDLLSTCAEDGHLNLYTYCNNNPVMYTDPTGEMGILTFLAIVGINALFAAIDGGITAAMQGQDFWLGAAAGAIGGIVGGLLNAANTFYFKKPELSVIARGVSSSLYNIFNELFQTGSLENMDWDYCVFDVASDMYFSSVLYADINVKNNLAEAAISGLEDAAVDIVQTVPLSILKLIEKNRLKSFSIYTRVGVGLNRMTL